MTAGLFNEVFDAEISRIVEDSGVNPEAWRTAGRKTAANPVGEDISWWRGEGAVQVEAYRDWLRRSNIRIATMPDGEPGIEWGLIGPVNEGGTPIKMIADLIIEAGKDEYIIVDNKSGQRVPQTVHQLALYATVMETNIGIRPYAGAYYMTRTAALTAPEALHPWGVTYWTHIIEKVRAAMEVGAFLPNPSWMCSGCSFRAKCAAFGGGQASLDDPILWGKIEAIPLTEHLSWSQINSFLSCGKAYQFSRLLQYPEQPSVWLAAGSAIHTAIEQINRTHWEEQQ